MRTWKQWKDKMKDHLNPKRAYARGHRAGRKLGQEEGRSTRQATSGLAILMREGERSQNQTVDEVRRHVDQNIVEPLTGIFTDELTKQS